MRQFRFIAVVTLGAISLVASGCSSDGQISAVDSTSTTERSTTTEADGTTDTKAKPVIELDDPGWAANATEHRDAIGERFDQECPRNPEQVAGSVWGVGAYTDDSSICTAAVQSGLITFLDGGAVTYEIAPGLDRYDTGLANGVTSSSYGSWAGSFIFPDAPPGTIDAAADPTSWQESAIGKGDPGTEFTVECSPNGQPGSVWGSGPYTADSSVCTAGVHAGAITVADGGPITAVLGAGVETYEGSEANGVTTNDYGAYDPSFEIVK